MPGPSLTVILWLPLDGLYRRSHHLRRRPL